MRALLLLGFAIAGFIHAAVRPVKITARHAGVEAIGSGVCLDVPCVHVLTNYHVAAFLGKSMKVEGTAVRDLQLFTGPSDIGAQEMEAGFGTFRYNPAKDLALITLSSALPAGFSRAQFAIYTPRVGQDVTRSARFGNEYDLAPGKIVADNVTHESAHGLLTPLPRHFLLDCPSRPGNSGGIVTDGVGKVIGIITMRSTNGQGEAGTVVLPVALVSEFLHGANEPLWRELFPVERALTRQLQPEPEPLPAGLGALKPAVPPRPESIETLRVRARENAAAMQNVMAYESVHTWGGNQTKRSWLFQIAMYADGQKYQRINANGAPTKNAATSFIPLRRMTGVVPGEQWSIISRLLDDASIEHEGVSTYEGKPANVFRYVSSPTGCASRYMGRMIYAGCSGVVVTDMDMNALLITQRMDLASGDATQIRWMERYEFVSLPARRLLLPVELNMSGEFRDGKTYFAAAQWSRYRIFIADSSLRFEEAVE